MLKDGIEYYLLDVDTGEVFLAKKNGPTNTIEPFDPPGTQFPTPDIKELISLIREYTGLVSE